MKYYIYKLDPHQRQTIHLTHSLSAFQTLEDDGQEFIVYTSIKNVCKDKPYAFYRADGGKLRRNKYKSSMYKIKQMLGMEWAA